MEDKKILIVADIHGSMIALDEIESTKVKKVSRPVLLVLAILFLVIGGVIFYPIYLHLNDYVILAQKSSVIPIDLENKQHRINLL